MNINDLNTIEQLEQFLTGSQPVSFLVASSKDECYRGIQRTLVKFRYASLNKHSKGVIVRFLIKLTGYSRQQITRLVKQYTVTPARLSSNSAPIRALNVCIQLKIFVCWPRLMSGITPSADRLLKSFASVHISSLSKPNTNG
jgi:hypothetical protein